MTAHHIGYLVKKIGRAETAFHGLGFRTVIPAARDALRGVTICVLEKDGYRVELISPAVGGSAVAGITEKFVNAPYHLCYQSERFDEELGQLCGQGFTLISEAAPAPVLGGGRAAFLMSPDIGMIELLEKRVP